MTDRNHDERLDDAAAPSPAAPTNEEHSTDPTLASLLHLHRDMRTVAGGEMDGVDHEFAADPRSDDCLTMPRLRTLAAGRDRADDEEAQHLAACTICSARRDAFRTRFESAPQPAPAPAPVTLTGSGRAIGWSAAAAAALIVVALLASLLITTENDDPFRSPLARWDSPTTASDPTPAPGEPDTASPPDAASAFGGPLSNSVWVEGFDQVTDDCAVVAFVRAWDDSCACLRWRLHRWLDADGKTQLHQELASGERFEVEIEVGASTPPVEQLVLVAAAQNAADLPTSDAAAEEFLACLAEPQCYDDADAIATYVNSAPDCFPEGVRLIPRSFIVE